jgi:AbrB family looped-hinge helix DNA binding protein
MNTTVTIDRAGRIIVPKALRDALQLEAGDTLELESQGEQLTLRPVRSGSALRKEHGVWVFRRGGAPINAEATNAVLDDVRGAGGRQGGRRG